MKRRVARNAIILIFILYKYLLGPCFSVWSLGQQPGPIRNAETQAQPDCLDQICVWTRFPDDLCACSVGDGIPFILVCLAVFKYVGFHLRNRTHTKLGSTSLMILFMPIKVIQHIWLNLRCMAEVILFCSQGTAEWKIMALLPPSR